MHTIAQIFLLSSLILIMLLTAGVDLVSYSNVYASEDYDTKQSEMDLDLSDDHYYVFPQNDNPLQKIKCNNINVNVNGLELDVFPQTLADDSGIAAEAVEDNTDENSFAGNNGHVSEINDFRFICINNNNNTESEAEPPISEQ